MGKKKKDSEDLSNFYSKAELKELGLIPDRKEKSSRTQSQSRSRSRSRSRTLGTTVGTETLLPRGSKGAGASGKRVLPSPNGPMQVARELLKDWNKEGVSTRVFLGGDWWKYKDGVYQITSKHDLVTDLYLTTEHAVCKKAGAVGDDGQPVFVRWEPNMRKISELRSSAEAICTPSDEISGGCWLKRDENEESRERNGLISMENGLFDFNSRSLIPHTPRYFATYQLPFEYQRGARCPRWWEFLESIFPGDHESKQLLQEWMWYVLSGRNDLERMMLFQGRSRSGKGTIVFILRKMMGECNVCGPTLESFNSNFGLQPLIGKSLAVIGDARSSRRLNTQQIIGRMLSITGRDKLDIDRKNRSMWNGVLPTRLMLVSNENPWFRDASGAIAGRMLLLKFDESFLGREDISLQGDLERELPGIFNWTLMGRRRLEKNGWKFTTPTSSLEAARDLAEEISPILAFIRERCELGKKYSATTTEMLDAYIDFMGTDGGKTRRDLGKSLGMQLLSAPIPSGARIERTRLSGKSRQRGYLGIRTKGAKKVGPSWS